MPRATVPFINRVAIIFDFDDTLAPDSFRSLLESCGIDKDRWERDHVKPRRDDGWDELLAKMTSLIETSRRLKEPITCGYLSRVGGQLELFGGVPAMFDRLRGRARDIIHDIEVEFYCLSSGFGQIACGSPIAGEFTAIYACEFYCDDYDRIAFIKRVVTHSEKVRYILQISKGLDSSGRQAEPVEVYRDVPPEKLHVPLSQIIYVGDGASDQPVFHLLHDSNGIALGVVKGDSMQHWKYTEEVTSDEHIQNLARADYRLDSELMQSLMLGLESMCKRIQLNRLGKEE